jgi:hypothetical protein
MMATTSRSPTVRLTPLEDLMRLEALAGTGDADARRVDGALMMQRPELRACAINCSAIQSAVRVR